jgi:hypothetical protein
MKGLVASLCVLFLLCFTIVVDAQFGVASKKETTTQEAQVGVDGETKIGGENNARPNDALISRLLQSQVLSEEQAVDIAALIESASKDPETALLLRRLKEGSGAKDAFGDFASDMSSMQIAQGLAQALEELEMLEILFKDPARAVREMEKEGMIANDRLSAYKKNPDLLEEDTRKHLYFTFVSIAAAGGYL